ncbi:DUF402 domain-containing protein [Nocardioides bigeumensis]
MTSEHDDTKVSESGGTMVRLDGPTRSAAPDLAALEPMRLPVDEPTVPVGAAAYLSPGDVVTWRYGLFVQLLRVVSDDERGLVAWLPAGSETEVATPRDGLGLRDRPLADRVRLSIQRDYDMVVKPWQGPGILRVAPAGKPWSIWYFYDEGGTFEGHYVNLELPHLRAADGGPRTFTRDLTLDIWVDADGDVWLKDEDELDAAVTGGAKTREQAGIIREVAEQARHELIAPRAWPLDQGWETWRPPPGWDDPLTFPRGTMEM